MPLAPRRCLPPLAIALMALGACTVHIDMRPALNDPRYKDPQPAQDEPSTDEVEAQSDGAPPEWLAGQWMEHWPDRVGCKDIAQISVRGGKVELTGADCNTQTPYTISKIRFEGRTLRFRLHVPETGLDLDYALELKDKKRLEGRIKGGTSAQVTWTRI